MLWNLIYEFFVTHIFGGAFNGNLFGGLLGDFYLTSDDEYIPYSTYEIKALTFDALDGTSLGYSLGNYLSLIATIISMVVIVILCCLLIKKIYNMCAHIIG